MVLKWVHLYASYVQFDQVNYSIAAKPNVSVEINTSPK